MFAHRAFVEDRLVMRDSIAPTPYGFNSIIKFLSAYPIWNVWEAGPDAVSSPQHPLKSLRR
jgi:hypothetical protein